MQFGAADQYSIAVKSGADLAANLMQLQLHKFITGPLDAGRLPPNPYKVFAYQHVQQIFFRSSGRLAQSPLHHPLPLALLSTASWPIQSMLPTAKWHMDYFNQHKGHAQGDYLCPLFSLALLSCPFCNI